MNAKIPVYTIQESANICTVAKVQYATHKHKKHIHHSVCLYVCITITQAVTPYSTVQGHFMVFFPLLNDSFEL